MKTSQTSSAARISQTVRAKRAMLLKLAREHGAKDVRLFGSVARGDARATSDVDVLVTMMPGRTLTDMAALKRSFSSTLGRPVDVISSSGISPYLRKKILSEAHPL